MVWLYSICLIHIDLLLITIVVIALLLTSSSKNSYLTTANSFSVPSFLLNNIRTKCSVMFLVGFWAVNLASTFKFPLSNPFVTILAFFLITEGKVTVICPKNSKAALELRNKWNKFHMTEMKKKIQSKFFCFLLKFTYLEQKEFKCMLIPVALIGCNVNYLQDTLKIGILRNHLLE